MYIGLKQIQYQLGDYSTLLTSSDGIHALTGWNKLYDAPQPLTIHYCIHALIHRNCSLSHLFRIYIFYVLFLRISIWIY